MQPTILDYVIFFASSDSERDPGYTAGCRGRHVAEWN